ncbi:alternative ribosome rescue aminoacyl-tRNA hydrolase ArfB [Maridesulfovibrio zosterae]|uniref:alternative ribosome rescue aminoacyl-tRNA hydrolase ArfB n=1 Tax=Maridesulfovibrio zosterae TaxID=82171 RepID=UPI00048787F3|nr:alternative ribosome rescue aminoacyl-tRNA hydrolase ArfB [Maridesulfovibrio zosterae]
MISITSTLSIPENEISFITSRSSGPGGQHVNKTSSKVTLVFNIQDSQNLTEFQKKRITGRLKNRINSRGELQLSCEEHRSQFRNKETVLERFANVLAEALKPVRQRHKTRVPLSSKRKRVNGKKKRSDVKKNRSKPEY